MSAAKTEIKSFINFIYNYSKDIPENEINFIYEGEINHQTILAFTTLIEAQLIKNGEKNIVKKKVFNILIEVLQNIYNHGNYLNNSENTESGKGVVMVNNNKTFYKITSGNIIKNDIIDVIKPLFFKINTCNEKSIRGLYKKQLAEGRISAKGGAGLGFIDMARKSGQKIDFDFIKIDSKLSFFIISFKIKKK